MPFFNNTVLKFINKPNLQLLNFKYFYANLSRCAHNPNAGLET